LVLVLMVVAMEGNRKLVRCDDDSKEVSIVVQSDWVTGMELGEFLKVTQITNKGGKESKN
jgi:hypothetical protein